MSAPWNRDRLFYARRSSLRAQLIALGSSEVGVDELIEAWEAAAVRMRIPAGPEFWDKAAAWIQMNERNAALARRERKSRWKPVVEDD